jgi:DNA modification methylase
MVLDPFSGSGTTALAARELGRHYICIEREGGHIRTTRNRLVE